MSLLEQIQRLQFTDLTTAHNLLRDFIHEVFGLEVAEVMLRPLAVSLNSFNGFLTLADGRRLFFKSHVEPGSVIAEYYNSDLLQAAGYPVIRPVYASTTPGRQMLLYEVVEDQSVFDIAWAIERGESGDLEALRIAQSAADNDLWRIYQKTLTWQDATANARAPVHQLFYHRLTQGRLDRFYGTGKTVALPALGTIPLAHVRRARWIINGVSFDDSLDDVITRAVGLLKPAHEGPAVMGHGDAHNGNVFLHKKPGKNPSMIYFDPAFAGRHDPLLDLAKPLYHNVFAMWMYFPDKLREEQGATLKPVGDQFVVSYEQKLKSVRDLFWKSKTERILIPLLQTLQAKGWLHPDWRAYLQSALACCPLLTMNLADAGRFPPPIALLGLAHVIEMGARTETSGTRSRIERWLDDVEAAL